MKNLKQARNWCFTDFELLDWQTIYTEYKDIIRYICVGEEICPKTQKKHKQGWLQFVNKKRMGGVKKMCRSKKIHLEACVGSERANSTYCKKDSLYFEKGTFVSQGARTDLEMMKKVIKEKPSIETAIEYSFETYCRYRNGIRDLIEMCQRQQQKKWRTVEVEYLFGKTGTGKTRLAMSHDDTFKIEGDSLKWFDGYCGEKTLVIDEYSNDLKITKLLNLLDGYKLRIPVKGGHTYACWERVIITSNLHPSELHPNAKSEHRSALFRRITKCAEVLQGNTRDLEPDEINSSETASLYI